MYVSALRRLSRARMHLVELRRPRRAPVSTGGRSTRTRKTAGGGVQLKRIRPRIRAGAKKPRQPGSAWLIPPGPEAVWPVLGVGPSAFAGP